MIFSYSYNLQNKCTKSLLYVSFIPYFRLLVFGIFCHLSCMIFFPFFPSHPSCLTKCKQELGNNFVFSPSDHKPKTKDGMKFTLVNILTLIWWTVISYIFLKMERKWKHTLIFSYLYWGHQPTSWPPLDLLLWQKLGSAFSTAAIYVNTSFI